MPPSGRARCATRWTDGSRAPAPPAAVTPTDLTATQQAQSRRAARRGRRAGPHPQSPSPRSASRRSTAAPPARSANVGRPAGPVHLPWPRRQPPTVVTVGARAAGRSTAPALNDAWDAWTARRDRAAARRPRQRSASAGRASRKTRPRSRRGARRPDPAGRRVTATPRPPTSRGQASAARLAQPQHKDIHNADPARRTHRVERPFYGDQRGSAVAVLGGGAHRWRGRPRRAAVRPGPGRAVRRRGHRPAVDRARRPPSGRRAARRVPAARRAGRAGDTPPGRPCYARRSAPTWSRWPTAGHAARSRQCHRGSSWTARACGSGCSAPAVDAAAIALDPQAPGTHAALAGGRHPGRAGRRRAPRPRRPPGAAVRTNRRVRAGWPSWSVRCRPGRSQRMAAKRIAPGRIGRERIDPERKPSTCSAGG